MLQYFQIFLLLSSAIFSVFTAYLDKNNQKNLSEVYVYVDTTSDITVAKAAGFMEKLKEKLTTSNVNLAFKSIQSPFTPFKENTVGLIRFEPIFDDKKIIEDYVVGVWAEPKQLKQLSPVLENKVAISNSVDAPITTDLVYAMMLLSVNHCDLAVPIFQRLKVSEPHIADSVDYNLATCELLQGSYLDSIALYERLIYMDTPRFLGTNLAWLYLKTGQEAQAFDLMYKSVETAKITDEDTDRLLAVRAQLYNLAFHYDDAVKDLIAAINLSPTDPALYTLRGQTYLLLYQWDNVLADYNKAIELDSTYADAYYYRGVLYYSILQTGQAMYNDALADFKHYLELAPNGEHATDATRYAADIQTQINALNN